jgi:predicted O-methyltransferase YrrM
VHTSTSNTVERVGTVATDHASRYLQQLCKHFGHKMQVSFDERAGEITFPFGHCAMMALDGQLQVTLTARDHDTLDRLSQVVVSHLVRFAFREDLAFSWSPAPVVAEHGLDTSVQAVLDEYHQRMADERQSPRAEPEGGRDGGQDMRMRAISPNTGRFLNTMARSMRGPTILEIGTSLGYSGIWLAEAARATGGRVITMELHEYKSAFAQEMARKAGLSDHVEFRVGDAVAMIEVLDHGVDFVFLDLWKDLYVPCLEVFYPKLKPGAVIVADNMIRPGGEGTQAYGKAVRAKPDITSVLLPVGTGLEISRYEPEQPAKGK